MEISFTKLETDVRVVASQLINKDKWLGNSKTKLEKLSKWHCFNNLTTKNKIIRILTTAMWK